MTVSELTSGDADPRTAVVGDVVELTVPALTDYLGVVRTATAGLAARLSFTLDEIEDLRIAVDEACLMLLSLPSPKPAGPKPASPRPAGPKPVDPKPAAATPAGASADGAMLRCRFLVLDDALAVTVSAAVDEQAQLPLEQSFAWQVITAHAAGVTGHASSGHAEIELLKRRRR